MESIGKRETFFILRHQSMVLLYRPSENKILEEGGPFYHQHDVNIIDNHRISILITTQKFFLMDTV